MIPVLLAVLGTLLVVGYPWHRSIRNVNERADQTRADHEEVSADNARLRTMLASAEADLEVERESYAASLAKSIRQTEDARADAEWAHVLHAIVLGELDRVTERHATLLTLDGVRADAAEGIRYPGEEPPLSLAVSTAEVVPIRKAKR